MAGDRRYRKLYLDDKTVRAVLRLEDYAMNLMMNDYRRVAIGMINDEAVRNGIEVTEDEREEMLQEMWSSIIVKKLRTFTKID